MGDEMRQILQACLVFLLSLPCSAFSKCAEMPNVKSDLEIRSCLPVQFNAGVTTLGYMTADPDASAKGVLIEGVVKASSIAWYRPLPHPKPEIFFPKPHESGSTQLIYLHGESPSRCQQVLGKTLKVTLLNMCCDVLPQTSQCIVPLSLKQGRLMSEEQKTWAHSEK